MIGTIVGLLVHDCDNVRFYLSNVTFQIVHAHAVNGLSLSMKMLQNGRYTKLGRNDRIG